MNTGIPVESPVRGNVHAGFGGRVGETERPKGRHRAPARPYTFRFNRRRSRHRGLLFYRLIEGALAADPHPYRRSARANPRHEPNSQRSPRIGGATWIAHFVNHEAEPERRHGPGAWAATRNHLRSAFGDVTYEILHVLADGDLAAVHLMMRGTHEGGIPPGVPATHRPFEARHVHMFRFADDGRVTEHWAVRDDLGAMRQVGLLG